ncbi:MAG: hypothetical protein P1P69_01860 [Methanosarcinaceae archaeon]|nr:hypothetical protein [Methanosarcinaceae archaeon]MDF1533233.1 hypothetical protein [Methanosarcinaceae archaeon]
MDKNKDKDKNREISVDIERNRLRVLISHGEDREVVKLTLDEARTLVGKIDGALEDYDQRKHQRID